jgi:hypothetical protein
MKVQPRCPLGEKPFTELQTQELPENSKSKQVGFNRNLNIKFKKTFLRISRYLYFFINLIWFLIWLLKLLDGIVLNLHPAFKESYYMLT